MVPIILILILSIGAALSGDNSGIQMIGMVVGFITLFMLIGYLLTQPILLLIIIGIIVLVIIICVCVEKTKGSKSNNNAQPQNHINNKAEESKQNYNLSEPSAFQKKLQQNTKTPQQVENEKWIAEKEVIIQTAENDYNYIKNELLNKAKNGEYINLDQHKHILYKYECSYLLNCVNRQYSRNPTGRIGTSSYRANEKVYYHINKPKQYDLYLSTILEFASKDNINMTPFFTERDAIYNKENIITIPYTYTHKHGIGVTSHKIKAYLKCTIQY